VSPLRRRDLRLSGETAAAAEEGRDLGMGSWVWNFEEMDRGKGWNLKLEGVRKCDFGFWRREEGGMTVVATVVVVVVMLTIFVLLLESTLV